MPDLTASEIGFDISIAPVDLKQNDIPLNEFSTYFMYNLFTISPKGFQPIPMYSCFDKY